MFGRDLLGVGNEFDRLVGQVLAQVVALLGRLGRLDLVVVVDQFGVILVGITAQEAIVALEAAPQRPAVVGSSGGLLLGGQEVILAEHVGVVALQQQHLREEAVLERDDGRCSRGSRWRTSVMHAMPLEWWLRPVMMHERVGEQSAVVCMLV